MRPHIGVTGPDRGGASAWLLTAWAVRLSGGRPVRITPRRGLPGRPLDGLIVGGGADVEPSRYGILEPPPSTRETRDNAASTRRARPFAGQVVAPLIYLLRRLLSVKRGPSVDQPRDDLEMRLLRAALTRDIPILGICRGAQLLNVTLGGTLHRDTGSLYTERPRPWTVLPAKEVKVEPGSHLARVLGTTRARVNSLHRQAVDQLGRGVLVSARETNGIVQGIELADRRFVLGVQWHPEYLPQQPEQRGLFRHMVRLAREHGPGRASSALTGRRSANQG